MCYWRGGDNALPGYRLVHVLMHSAQCRHHFNRLKQQTRNIWGVSRQTNLSDQNKSEKIWKLVFFTTWYDVCRCSEEPLCSHCCAPWGPVYPTNDVKERMGGGGGWEKKTAYGSASYIKEATRCAVIHCQFALFVSCSPSSLPHSPRWLSRGNKGTSVVPTPSPSLVEPPFNELHTVSTAKSGLLLSNGISPLLSALGRASRSALSLQNTSTLPSATSQTEGGGGGGGGNKWSV